MTKPADTTLRESRRQSAAVERVTGEWYCPSASHYTKSEQTRWRGRRICVPCRDRLAALARKRPNTPN